MGDGCSKRNEINSTFPLCHYLDLPLLLLYVLIIEVGDKDLRLSS